MPAVALLSDNLAPTLPQAPSERRQRRLHPDLDRLKRTQEDVSNKLCARRSSEKQHGLVDVGKELLAIVILEDFVEPIFAGALKRVSDEGRGPTEEYPPEALFGVDCAPGLHVGRVDFGVDLTTALDEIERCYGCVCRSTSYTVSEY